MTLDATALQRALTSHAKGLGIFERVHGFDPKNAPGSGLTCALLARTISARPTTGLNRSAALVVWMMRVMWPLPKSDATLEDVDPRVVGAVDKIVNSLMGAFTLGGLVRAVDIRGMAGTPLGVDFGYVEVDGKMFRIGDVTVPLIVNDVWAEVP